MKRLIFLLLVVSLASVSHAQFATTLPLVAGDTVVNTATITKTIQITTGYEGVGLQVIGTKISGTVGGTIGLYGSMDGVSYDLIGSTFTPTDVASNVKSFYLLAPLPVYIQARWTGTGTMSAKWTIRYVARRHD